MTTFSAIVGHARLTALLSRAIARQSLPPTLLFEGPAGVGKHRTAIAVAATLNCLSPIAGGASLPLDACGTCRSCDRVARNLHVDVIDIEPDAAAHIKVDVIRDILERSNFRPFEGQRRVVVLRDADAMVVPAQNALLKSLEEPPPSTVFILTSAVTGLLLPTVLSRSVRMRFARLPSEEVVGVLVREHDLSPEAARAAAVVADGSVGQALAAISTDLADLRDSALLLLRRSAASHAAAARLKAAESLVGGANKDRGREEIILTVRVLATMLRDIELLKSGADRRALANPDIAEDLSALTTAFAGDRARDAFASADKAIVALTGNAGSRVVSEWLALQI